MKVMQILPFARNLLERTCSNGDIVVDGTLGNGHDTEFLAHLVGPTGQVFGFDIQEQAILNTRKRLEDLHLNQQVTLFHHGHEKIKESIPSDLHGKIKGAIFNLGYLPGGDKSIVTKPETTIAAIRQLLELMAIEGIIVLVIYHGHQEGAVERDAIIEFTQSIDQQKAHVIQYGFINQNNHPPFIIAIEKRRD
ncbi:class I SAM-dependent methyltransferase [Niallia sp. Krafla_26]|uniref:tRNA (mnm(5)s(2)U34)-methyltransferase n=1 Tax=Niallia sp. Krafla_26 TaxID=3064703 RepID=UPI003D183AB4